MAIEPYLNFNGNGVEEGEQVFARLADRGTVEMPFQATSWTSGFGMTRDRFGVSSVVNVVARNVSGPQ